MTNEERVLEREVAIEREALGENLAAFKQEAEALADWHTYVRKNPLKMVGVAIGGGLLLGAMTGGGRRRGRGGKRHNTETIVHEHVSREPKAPSPVNEAWHSLRNALVGAATTQLGSYVSKVLPDFRHELEAQRNTRLRDPLRP